MLTRRKLVLGAALAVLVPAAPALAAPDPLLADILYGVSDALIRDYIYRNYEYGRWDGRYWWYRGNRYTPATYRRFWIDDYYRHYPPPPPAHRPPPGHRPPPLRPPVINGCCSNEAILVNTRSGKDRPQQLDITLDID